jgi:membrane-associated PAP2 superfamily phosphatase
MAIGLIFGTLMSVARIAQGGHFLSDTVWAWGIVHLCALVLVSLLKIAHEPAAART